MNRNRLWLSALAIVALAMPAFAADDPAPPEDYRWAVYTGCSLVFGAIVVFLVTTHMRGARLAEDLDRLGRRVDALEQ